MTTEVPETAFAERARQTDIGDLLTSLQLRVYSKVTPGYDEPTFRDPGVAEKASRIADIPDQFILEAITRRVPQLNDAEFEATTQTMTAATNALIERGENIEPAYAKGLPALHYAVGLREGLMGIESQIPSPADDELNDAESRANEARFGTLLDSVQSTVTAYANRLSGRPSGKGYDKREDIPTEISMATLARRISDVREEDFMTARTTISGLTLRLGETKMKINPVHVKGLTTLNYAIGHRQGQIKAQATS